MEIRNFKYKKIGIYIKNILFNFLKNLNLSESEKNLIKLDKMMDNVNIKNVDVKLKAINDLYKNNEYDPFLCEAVATYEQGLAKNPLDGYEKIKKYSLLKKDWIKKNNLGHLETEFVPESSVTGCLGNHWTLFHYLMYKINIENSVKKPNLLLYENQKITNSALYNYFAPYLNIIQNSSSYNKLQSVRKIFKTPIEFSLPFKGKNYPWFVVINKMNQLLKDKKGKNFNYFKIDKQDYKKGKNILKKMGIPDGAWYVVLHVREGNGNELFNSNPLTYVKSIKEIVKRGGYVFRMGDKKMTPLPKIHGLIDYPFTEYKSEFLDVFLAGTCRFCLGTSSGYWPLAIYFGKPVLLANYLPILEYYSLDEKSMFLPKRLVNKNTKKLVSIKDMFKFPLGYLVRNIQLNQNNVQAIDNNEEEIFQSTYEMLNILEGKKIVKNLLL